MHDSVAQQLRGTARLYMDAPYPYARPNGYTCILNLSINVNMNGNSETKISDYLL
jgi:hypothetical protein